jgi:hypothetical protein
VINIIASSWSGLDSILFFKTRKLCPYKDRQRTGASSWHRCFEIMNVFENSAMKLVQETSNEIGWKGHDGTELGQINTMLIVVHDPISSVRISI